MQVRNLELPERHELRKLQQLKEEAGEMTAADERKLRGLQRATEREILQAADVVCVTCVGAGDLRLTNFRFRQVCLLPLHPGRSRNASDMHADCSDLATLQGTDQHVAIC